MLPKTAVKKISDTYCGTIHNGSLAQADFTQHVVEMAHIQSNFHQPRRGTTSRFKWKSYKRVHLAVFSADRLCRAQTPALWSPESGANFCILFHNVTDFGTWRPALYNAKMSLGRTLIQSFPAFFSRSFFNGLLCFYDLLHITESRNATNLTYKKWKKCFYHVLLVFIT